MQKVQVLLCYEAEGDGLCQSGSRACTLLTARKTKAEKRKRRQIATHIDGKGFDEEKNDEPKEEKKNDEPLPEESDEPGQPAERGPQHSSGLPRKVRWEHAEEGSPFGAPPMHAAT